MRQLEYFEGNGNILYYDFGVGLMGVYDSKLSEISTLNRCNLFALNKIDKRKKISKTLTDETNIIQETEDKSVEIIIEMMGMVSVPRRILFIQRKAADSPGERGIVRPPVM